ncbi:SDR family NAD(P)-dependent oxidoreductase [Acidisoma cellulosilytica]|uniref:SDR family NAD(P)-dependent oxidoreductase n=1 Tax=Acidisoma cellulosilyticum TaxID=2802395 RepID=A0A964E5E3_9PROT|nr:oxidoreductase [Acidisoma cellulosilyticum]MCB8881883.1 SDR family NAD(P)-dependent oxidoreductase [Acidisoma cellulosilyticum]
MTTWLITGIGRGLGKAMAEAALARGDTVIGTVREGQPDIAVGQGQLHILPLEITDATSVTETVTRAFALTGRIDVIVNNAGYGLLGAAEEASDAEVARLFAVNVFGPFQLIRAALPRLRAQGAGHIINVTSIAGRAPMASSALYAATKFAMEGLSAALAQEVAPFGLTVTAVAPGGFRTDFLSDHSIRRSKSDVADAYAPTVGKALAYMDGMAGKQIGDPDRAAMAIIALVDSAAPPLHLLLGSDALRRARAKLADVNAEIDTWEAVTLSTDYPTEV